MWYLFLSSELECKPVSKFEAAFPEIEWELVWTHARLPFLSSETISFAFKLIHLLLPTEQRLASFLPNTTATCKFNCYDKPDADYNHVFFGCQLSAEIGSWLMKLLRDFEEDITPEQVLRLHMNTCHSLISSLLPLKPSHSSGGSE